MKDVNIEEHRLKTWPRFFNLIKNGAKTFEVRKNDRDFKVGDILILEEWNPSTKEYTGDYIEKYISYILHGDQFGIEKGYCVMCFE